LLEKIITLIVDRWGEGRVSFAYLHTQIHTEEVSASKRDISCVACERLNHILICIYYPSSVFESVVQNVFGGFQNCKDALYTTRIQFPPLQNSGTR